MTGLVVVVNEVKMTDLRFGKCGKMTGLVVVVKVVKMTGLGGCGQCGEKDGFNGCGQ